MKWISVDDQKPWADCDIKLTDGSILKHVIPQSDGDYYWRCRENGELFIREEAVVSWAHSETPKDHIINKQEIDK